MNMLRDGAAWLARQMIDSASDPVTYSRDSVSLSIQATKGTTSFDSEQADGSMIRFEAIDFLITASTLIPSMGLPQDGDQIHDGEHTYELLALSGVQPFRYSDRHRTILRVHTKQIG
jgi:hypothetical protein